MLTPSFQLNIYDNKYSVIPTFELHFKLEEKLGVTLYSLLANKIDTGFSVSELYDIYSLLDCNKLGEDTLKEYIATNRVEANRQISELIMFLVLPQKQEEQLKKK